MATLVFHYVMGDSVTVSDRVPDGTRVAPGDVVMRVSGPTRGLLTAERTALNYASHLSGVATATATWVDALEGTRARVLDTRKTLPGYRALQKYAVRCGRGQPPVQPRGHGDGQGQPRDRRGRRRLGVRRRPAAHPEPRVEVEVTDPTSSTSCSTPGRREILVDNMSNGDHGRRRSR